jgi:hypothetical protein
MSVTFAAQSVLVDEDDSSSYLNISNVNARELLTWLGLSPDDDLDGECAVLDLAARCRRRLWPIPRNEDAGVPSAEFGGNGTGECRTVDLPETTARLLELCERAGTGAIRWY